MREGSVGVAGFEGRARVRCEEEEGCEVNLMFDGRLPRGIWALFFCAAGVTRGSRGRRRHDV